MWLATSSYLLPLLFPQTGSWCHHSFFPEFSLCSGVLPILSYLAIGHSVFYYISHSNTSSNSIQISHNSFHYKRAAILWGQACDTLIWMWNALDRLMCWMLCPWLVMLFMEENISLWEMTKVQVVFGPGVPLYLSASWPQWYELHCPHNHGLKSLKLWVLKI